MSGLRERYLRAMGIPVWMSREGDVEPGAAGPEASVGVPAEAEPREAEPGALAGAPAEAVPRASAAAAPSPAAAAHDVERLDWEPLEQLVKTCTLCPLHATRTNAVFGVGNRRAELLVVGEAPGADEDRQGEPFVGRAGRLLNAMLRAIGYERADVYIANILKCRPPSNRDPQPLESKTCTPYLERQMALIAPKAVLAVGRVSAQWLLQSDRPIGTLRGRIYRYGTSQVPLVVTYHPAYLLRSPEAKAKAWEDLCIVKSMLDERE